MGFDSEEGMYLFEVVLGYETDGGMKYSAPFLVQADDPEEAEEKAMDHLEDLDLDQELWVEEIGEPFELDGYEARTGESGRGSLPLLLETSGEEIQELLGN